MNILMRSPLLFVCLSLTETLTGCSRYAPKVAPLQTPVVPVSEVVERQVTDFVEFTGRTDAVETVSIIPRVTGYLVKLPFKEGSLVKTGDLLFEVDPRPYQAQLDQAEGQVKLYEAQLKLATTTLNRDLGISQTPGAVSPEQLDQDRAAVDQAQASVDAARASLEVFKLNLSFCQVTSPIDGMVARYFFTLGNLVNQDQTLLTTVVSLDPMYAYFDMDEATLLQIRQAIGAGQIKTDRKDGFQVFMGLQGEEGYPHVGTVNFVNNQLNPATGSIAVRGVFRNPALKEGIRLMSPGMFVRIHLPIGQEHPALLVIDRAIGSDQGLKYVYVIDGQNNAEYRRVTTGPLQSDGLRVIADGLNRGDRVAVGALQQIRPNTRVQTEDVPMPILGQPGGSGQPSSESRSPEQTETSKSQ
jgi:membrane fusion protein, multidrug efflux system